MEIKIIALYVYLMCLTYCWLCQSCLPLLPCLQTVMELLGNTVQTMATHSYSYKPNTDKADVDIVTIYRHDSSLTRCHGHQLQWRHTIINGGKVKSNTLCTFVFTHLNDVLFCIIIMYKQF